jgi:hypothetical protein
MGRKHAVPSGFQTEDNEDFFLRGIVFELPDYTPV